MIHIDFFEFIATKFKLNLRFVHLFIQSLSSKNKNLCSLNNVLKQNVHSIYGKNKDMFRQKCNNPLVKIS